MHGQSSLEYLMVYGFVIMIITVAGAVLYKNIFTKSTEHEAPSSALTFGKDIYMEDYVLYDNGRLDLSLVPKEDLTLTGININGNYNRYEKEMNEGASYKIVAYTNLTGKPGKKYNYNITFYYTTKFNKSFSVSLIGKYQRFWLYPFKYRRKITLSTSQNLTDYQLKINLNTEDLISNDKLSEYCSDLRFVNENGKELEYFIEKKEKEERIINKSISGWKMYSMTSCSSTCDPLSSCTPPSGWYEVDYDDSSWASISTPNQGWGCDSCSRAYRYTFYLNEAPSKATLYVRSDDGVICYLNGVQIHYYSSCRSASYWNDIVNVDVSNFRIGKNVIACQVAENSGYEAFDLMLEGTFKTCKSSNTKIYILIPQVYDGKEIYMYYGNKNAEDESNSSIFLFFDDFDSLDLTKWFGDTTGFTASNSYLTGTTTTGYLRSMTTFSEPIVQEVKVIVNNKPTNGVSIAGFFASTSNSIGLLAHPSYDYLRNNSAWINIGSKINENETYLIVFAANGSNVNVKIYNYSDDNIIYNNIIGGNDVSNEYISLGRRYDNAYVGQSYLAKWDYIIIRKYPESIGYTIGSEERK